MAEPLLQRGDIYDLAVTQLHEDGGLGSRTAPASRKCSFSTNGYSRFCPG
jgi:hypothetical protein